MEQEQNHSDARADYLEKMDTHQWEPSYEHATYKCQCGAKKVVYSTGPRVLGKLVCPIYGEEADLIDLLRALRNETRPIDGHTDPGAIEDTWNEVFERLDIR